MTVVFIVVAVYLYCSMSVGKFVYWTKYGLMFENDSEHDALYSAVFWPYLLMIEPKTVVRAVLTPSMYLSREFRELYPTIQKERELDRKRELEFRREKYIRACTEKRAVAVLENRKQSLVHEVNMKEIARVLDLVSTKQLELASGDLDDSSLQYGLNAEAEDAPIPGDTRCWSLDCCVNEER